MTLTPSDPINTKNDDVNAVEESNQSDIMPSGTNETSTDNNPDVTSTSSAPTPATTRVMRVLTNGRKNLWNSYYPINIFGLVLNPCRDFILDPLFAIGTILLPPIVVYIDNIYVDYTISYILSASIYIMKFFYCPIVIEEHMNLRQTAKQDFIINTKAAYHLPKYHPPSDIVSAFRGMIAFTLSVSADVISLIVDRNKMMKWMETLTELKSYLDASGVSSELDESIVKPLYSGRLLDNLKILSDVQGNMYIDRNILIAQITSINELQDYIKIGHRMMRFATSAYGTEMIRSALDREASVREFMGHDDNYQIHKAIAFHSGIADINDIRILEVNDGGDMHLLRHFVAIDHLSNSVVLAIRGTLSISGALVDMTAMDGDFCGGKAHKGMSEMADNVWSKSGEKIKAIFQSDEKLENYSFTIVGHSLGAGVACLLQIKCYQEDLLGPKRVVRCYGFAPPPTFCYDEQHCDTKIQQAIENTICYVHDNDCVPLLSVMSVRRFSVLMDTVDDHTEHLWFYNRFLMFWGWKDIPSTIVDAIKIVEKEKVTTMECCDGASKLVIPAKTIIWMKKDVTTGTYTATGCSPQSVADLNIFFCQDMITDHLVEPYEDSLDELAKYFEGDTK